ncbi:MAG: ferredoxin [Candidatus Moranbacteria bacterium]|nr:ferredoxin [Candidatus Moranbacteria bacterium]
MKVTIDEDACIGCGLCATICDECFQIDGNVAKVKKTDCEKDKVSEAAENCPAGAIKIEE